MSASAILSIFPGANLIAAWICILLGFLSGTVLGLFFHRENWLGGYASLRRRLYRLAHISLFGLGAVNLLFYLTRSALPAQSPAVAIASGAFILGAAAMPVCCVLMAHFPRALPLFGIPVISLLLGAVLTLISLLQAHAGASPQALLAPNASPLILPVSFL